jgi:hypothetical protein
MMAAANHPPFFNMTSLKLTQTHAWVAKLGWLDVH